ncbi:hypothetical protein R3P38DRAFT_2982308 [Favolaschia claudopus]|uniref:F-box domain-containing protein n=1 Tax=Favolaschia claudopus TaxID=2862362 RepID=A0AAW0AXP3_9AGAR
MSQIDVESESALPPDLEREIFKICALTHPRSISKLLRVARRVKEWAEPFLYRTILVHREFTFKSEHFPIFTWNALQRAIDTKPPSFFAAAVRNLMIIVYDEIFNSSPLAATIGQLLTLCTGVERLELRYSPVDPILLVDKQIQPTRLYVELKENFFRDFPPSHSFFSQLTHFQIGSWPVRNVERSSNVIRQILHACKSLQVVVNLGQRYEQAPPATPIRDPRLVSLRHGNHIVDWQQGAYCGQDFWFLAEAVIRFRQSGNIDASVLPDAHSEYMHPNLWASQN